MYDLLSGVHGRGIHCSLNGLPEGASPFESRGTVRDVHGHRNDAEETRPPNRWWGTVSHIVN